jgi:serine/threonine protein kinase
MQDGIVALHDETYYTGLVDRLFCGKNARYGPFVRDDPPVIVVPNLIVRVEVHRPGDESDTFELSIFDGIDGFAGELWEHEVRSLLRLEALDHPALPKIRTGGYDDQEKIAYTLTVNAGATVHLDDSIKWAQSHPIEAFEQFSILLDALRHLHSSRILHRNLTASALRGETSGGSTSFRLSRFELSTLIGNILRQVSSRQDSAARAMIRQLYLTPPPGMELARHLAYLAPEMHSYLFDEHIDNRSDWETTDIFGMGVLGWEWFCGDIPKLLPKQYEAVSAAAAVSMTSPSDVAANSATAELMAALTALHHAMRAHLSVRADIPRPLTVILDKMLDRLATGRETSFQLSRRIESDWEAIRGVWEPDTGIKAYLLAFMPAEAIDTIYEKRHWISRSPEHEAGRDELKMFLERELQRAELVRSPTGAVGYATGPEDTLREAEWILIGERALWFCAIYYQQNAFGTRLGDLDQVLVIKYLKEKEYAQELAISRPRRRIGKLDLITYRPGQDLSGQCAGRPSWRALMDSIAHARRSDSRNQEFLQSLDFLLDYQRTALEARQYPYQRVDGAGPGRATIALATSRDNAWKHRSPMLTAYSRKFRPMFGDFFGETEGDEDLIRLDVQDGATPTPFFGGRRISAVFAERKDQDTIVVIPEAGAQIPAAGWVRRSDDGGSRTQLDRQLRARIALDMQPGLIRNLRDPLSIDLGRGRWSGADAGHSSSGRPLDGDAPRRIRDMLAYHPFYALQGPPGSGKTTVAANAIDRFLDAEGGARVLVSAQSNFALDNLGKRLVKDLPRDTLILRVTTEGGDAPDKPVDRHTLNALTRSLSDQVRDRLRSAAYRSSLGDRERVLADEWLSCIESNQVELGDRIRAGASVVLATCSMAATLLDGTRDAAEMFDWVIVEEAAKAWPTEIVVPLVLGARWALIGDHRQLGAHRSQEVAQFLGSLRRSSDEDLQRHYEQRQVRLRTLGLFRSLFEAAEAAAEPGGHVRPCDRLTWQFRMHKDIAQPVARAFYPVEPVQQDADELPVSFLNTSSAANVAHGVVHPGFLKGTSLVWVDTTGDNQYVDKRQWSNAGECDLIAAIVERMDPPPAPSGADDDDDGSLVVLTPYRAQVKLLNNKGELRGRVHTVHSFQGREADRVIVSLVRSARRGTTPSANVGHVGQDEVANVLLSRARRLCILVGSYGHFAAYGGPKWSIIAEAVARYGTIVDAGRLEFP